MYAATIAIGDRPVLYRATAALSERSMASANAVDAYESRRNDGSGAGAGDAAGDAPTRAGARTRAVLRFGDA